MLARVVLVMGSPQGLDTPLKTRGNVSGSLAQSRKGRRENVDKQVCGGPACVFMVIGGPEAAADYFQVLATI